AAVGLERQRGAGLHGDAVEMDHAGAALRGVAANMGAGQPQMFAQELDQEGTGIDVGGDGFAVHRHGYCGHGVLLNSSQNGPFFEPDFRPSPTNPHETERFWPISIFGTRASWTWRDVRSRPRAASLTGG